MDITARKASDEGEERLKVNKGRKFFVKPLAAFEPNELFPGIFVHTGQHSHAVSLLCSCLRENTHFDFLEVRVDSPEHSKKKFLHAIECFLDSLSVEINFGSDFQGSALGMNPVMLPKKMHKVHAFYMTDRCECSDTEHFLLGVMFQVGVPSRKVASFVFRMHVEKNYRLPLEVMKGP